MRERLAGAGDDCVLVLTSQAFEVTEETAQALFVEAQLSQPHGSWESLAGTSTSLILSVMQLVMMLHSSKTFPLRLSKHFTHDM